MVMLQGNLKSTIVVSSSDSLPVIADLPGADFHQIQEDQALQHLYSAREALSPVLHRPQLLLSFLPVRIVWPAFQFRTEDGIKWTNLSKIHSMMNLHFISGTCLRRHVEARKL